MSVCRHWNVANRSSLAFLRSGGGSSLLGGFSCCKTVLDEFVDSDALIGCFALRLFVLDMLMVRKVLEVLGMVVRLVSLGFRGGMEFLCRVE